MRGLIQRKCRGQECFGVSAWAGTSWAIAPAAQNASSGPSAACIRACPAQPKLLTSVFTATRMPSLPLPEPQNSLSGPAAASEQLPDPARVFMNTYPATPEPQNSFSGPAVASKPPPSPARASMATCASSTKSSDQLSPAPQHLLPCQQAPAFNVYNKHRK